MSAPSPDVLRGVEKVSFEKLSELQKFILVALMEPKLAAARPREFAVAIKRLYWGADSPSARKSLSRALQRLERRGYIMRLDRHWQLTGSDALDYNHNGLAIAILAWAQRIELYASIGFQGALPFLQKANSGGLAQKETKNESLFQIEQAPHARQKERPGVKTPLDTD